MGKPKPPEKALLFIGILYAEEPYYEKAKEALCQEFGELLFESPPMAWEHTEYYRDELGWPITRRFLATRRCIDPSSIVDIKLYTNELEETLSVEGKRKVNLDPGYVTASKVVLATTKNYAHRVYIAKGIYAEVTLYYRKGTFRAHDFTYRDYRSPEYIKLFEDMRNYILGK